MDWTGVRTSERSSRSGVAWVRPIGARGRLQFCRPKSREMSDAPFSPPFLPPPHDCHLLCPPSLRHCVTDVVNRKTTRNYNTVLPTVIPYLANPLKSVPLRFGKLLIWGQQFQNGSNQKKFTWKKHLLCMSATGCK